MTTLSLASVVSPTIDGVAGEGAPRAVSPTVAMPPLTAIFILVAWPCWRATEAHLSRDHVENTLRSLFGKQYQPVKRFISCSQVLGPTKCASALSAWRAERAIQAYETNPKALFNLTEDVNRFPWTKYENTTEEQLYSQLCDDTEKLLQRRPLMLNMIPGFKLHLESTGNGTMNIDVIKSNDQQSGRSTMKKLQNKFYQVMPLLALPGLIMAAILPFLLPALTMMTLAATMMNNMVLVGSIFTLLRNNAFDDRYEHRVLYVNKGYKNEKHATVSEEHIHTNHDGVFYSDGGDPIDQYAEQEHAYGEDFDSIDESPALQHGWPHHLKGMKFQ